MDIIVLLKLVADIDHIPPDAWDVENGTLRRGRLHMVSNPLDDRALRAAVECARSAGGRVFVLSMGPRAAEGACRRALAHGADEAILLSDAAFAGADTLATARVLAAAVRRVQRDYSLAAPLIFAGMQSPDGDTAQVPAAVAALLETPLLPYVSSFDSGGTPGSVRIELLQRRGRASASITGGPLILTFTGLAPQLPFAASLAAMIHGSQARVERWGAEDLGIDVTSTGLAGSATRVVEIRSVAHGSDHGHRVNLMENNDPAAAIDELVRQVTEDLATPANRPPGDDHHPANRPPDDDHHPANDPHDDHHPANGPHDEHALRDAPAGDPAAGGTATTERKLPSSRSDPGAIWTYIEPDEQGSLEILGEARRLADELRVESIAILCARRPTDELVHTLHERGATGVLLVQQPPEPSSPVDEILLHHRDAALLASAARLRRPRTILIAATLLGRTVSALAATELGAGLTADCTGLRLETGDGRDRRPADSETSASLAAAPAHDSQPGDEPKPADTPPLLQIRPALGGNILATIVSTARAAGLPEMATVRSGVFPLREYGRPEAGPPTTLRAARPVTKLADRPAEPPQTAGRDPSAAEICKVSDTIEIVTLPGSQSRTMKLAITEVTATGPRTSNQSSAQSGVNPEAQIIVAVGAGIGSAERLARYVMPLVEQLASKLRVTTSLACSRAVVDAGILPYEYQIGQTGKSVRPALYIALGISGAIQHRLGMEHSARVLSINPDPEAPIHALSDYSVVSTVEDTVPLLLSSIGAYRHGAAPAD